MPKCDNKLNLLQNTVLSVTNFTQTSNILHHPAPDGVDGDILQVFLVGDESQSEILYLLHSVAERWNLGNVVKKTSSSRAGG